MRELKNNLDFEQDSAAEFSGSEHCGAEPYPQVLLLDSTYAEEIAALEQLAYPSPWSKELVRNEFSKEISFRLGLKFQGRILAYALNYLLPGELHILNLAVVPEYRHQGLGRYLLCFVLEEACRQGVEAVSLEVRRSNLGAQKLYRQMGFLISGTRRNYYRDNGEDALLLDRRLLAGDHRFFERLRADVTQRWGLTGCWRA